MSLLRWLDALAGWIVVSGLALALAPDLTGAAAASLGLALVALACVVGPLRARWRPVSAAVGIAVSASLQPGDRAWYVRGGEAAIVVVTARRGLRLVIATAADGGAEGISVRRTRVLLVPAEIR